MPFFTHRSFVAIAALLVGLLLPVAGFTQNPANIKLSTTKLNDHLYMIEPTPPMAGNLAVSAGADGILLVDDQMMEVAPAIRAAIAEIQEGEVEFLVNTHWHFDHAGGNAAFGLEAAILAHENVRERLLTGSAEGSRFPVPPAPAEALPVLTYREGVTLHWNGERVDIVHLPPAHTDGDSIIIFRDSNVVHMGDLFFNTGGFPFADLESGGNALGVRDNVKTVLEMVDDEVRIIPGHGPLASKADLERYHDVLDMTINHVSAAANAGKSLEEITAAGLPEEFKSYGTGGFIPEAAWIQFVFDSM